MKFFHLSDLHIGLKLMNRDLREDQEAVLGQIVQYAKKEKPDAVVIAGDIYDKAVPSAEAVEVLNRFITQLTDAVPDAAVMMISGNHDSGPRLNCFREVLARQNLYMIGMPPQNGEESMEKVTLQDAYGDVNFYLLPFVKPSMVKQITGADENGVNFSYEDTLEKLVEREKIDQSRRNVLVSHQFYIPPGKNPEDTERMDSEIQTAGNIDAVSTQVLECFDYAALGHIHKPMKAGRENFCYCGTPLAYSVKEAGQEKGIVMVNMQEKGAQIQIRVLPLHPLRRVRVIRGELEEVLAQGCEDYVSVVLTDRADLDVIDMQDRIRSAFPYLLELKREGLKKADYSTHQAYLEELDPFSLCCRFFSSLDETEKEILLDVIHTVQEVQQG